MATNHYTDMLSEVLVFKTNISTERQLESVSTILSSVQNIIQWNVDRKDIDNVLRITCEQLSPNTIIEALRKAGFECEELPD
ncbi:hypothetical protein [Chryseolinea sp. H1M3-3]|uniref:hypothetical protein n=1 Tax=Chryseolinea sp. H1M3-3 TaxID=3034144 RepID=UPI0023ED3DE5|nr:hypothetical protein [Chryseolinea sp. H1M3-3]